VPVLVDDPNLHIEIRTDGLLHVKVMEATPDDAINGSTRPEVDDIMDTIEHYLEQHAPVNQMIDMSGVPDMTLSERWRLAARMKANRQYIRRTAVFGLTPQMAVAYRVIARVARRRDMCIFDDFDEARSWLLEELRREMVEGTPPG
jgi:hypothetical protein